MPAAVPLALALGALAGSCAPPVQTGRDPCIDVYDNAFRVCARGVHCDADAGQDCGDMIELRCPPRACDALATCCAGVDGVSTSCAEGCPF